MNIDSLSESGKPSSGRARYDSPLRREQAEHTRQAIAAAARRLFSERGWSGTRVRDVAAEAGVAEPTVYATYGSKKGLANALVDALEDVPDVADAAAALAAESGNPAGQLAALVRADRYRFEQGGDVIALLREAGRSQPELRAAYLNGRTRGDRLRREVFAAWPAGTLRDGIDTGDAADTYAALCTIDVYDVLTGERGYPPNDVEHWWHSSLARLLLR